MLSAISHALRHATYGSSSSASTTSDASYERGDATDYSAGSDDSNASRFEDRGVRADLGAKGPREPAVTTSSAPPVAGTSPLQEPINDPASQQNQTPAAVSGPPMVAPMVPPKVDVEPSVSGHPGPGISAHAVPTERSLAPEAAAFALSEEERSVMEERRQDLSVLSRNASSLAAAVDSSIQSILTQTEQSQTEGRYRAEAELEGLLNRQDQANRDLREAYTKWKAMEADADTVSSRATRPDDLSHILEVRSIPATEKDVIDPRDSISSRIYQAGVARKAATPPHARQAPLAGQVSPHIVWDKDLPRRKDSLGGQPAGSMSNLEYHHGHDSAEVGSIRDSQSIASTAVTNSNFEEASSIHNWKPPTPLAYKIREGDVRDLTERALAPPVLGTKTNVHGVPVRVWGEPTSNPYDDASSHVASLNQATASVHGAADAQDDNASLAESSFTTEYPSSVSLRKRLHAPKRWVGDGQDDERDRGPEAKPPKNMRNLYGLLTPKNSSGSSLHGPDDKTSHAGPSGDDNERALLRKRNRGRSASS